MLQSREVVREEVKRGGNLDDSEGAHMQSSGRSDVGHEEKTALEEWPEPPAGWDFQLLRWEKWVWRKQAEAQICTQSFRDTY